MANGRFGFERGGRPIRDTTGRLISGNPLANIPLRLQGLSEEFLSEGLIPQAELGGIVSSSARESAFRRRALGRGLRRRQGRRLGSRSSTIDQLVANRVFAPSFAGFEAGTRDLFARNRFGGRTAGINTLSTSFNQFFQNRARRDSLELARQQRQDFLDSQSGGLGGLVGGALPIIGDIFGGPAGGAAGGAAGQTARQFV